MNQINVLGIDIDCYSLKEALVLTDTYLQEGPLHTIIYIDARMLMAAGENEEYAEYIKKCDLIVLDDVGILEALPEVYVLKADDIKEEKYTRILLKKMVYGHKKIALLSDTADNLHGLESNLINYRNDFDIVSKVSLDALEDSTERMINEMNDVVPDVIISRIEPFRQVKLMEEARSMMNCKAWIGLPERTILLQKDRAVIKRFWNKLFSRFFKKEVQKYHTKENEE